MKQNEILIRRYFEEVWNKGDVDLLDELLAPDYINHNPGAPDAKLGPAGLKPIVLAIRQAFPDLNYTIKNVVATEAQVAVHTVMKGTHLGDFFGMAPASRVIHVEQMQIERVVNGRIAEHWRVTDELSLLKQLGQIES